MARVLAFGEILWDKIEEDYHLGGAPLNFAAHAWKCGLKSGIISCVGNDSLGEKAIEQVKKLGVATDLILRRNKKTGVVNVTIEDGQPSYEILKPRAFDYIDFGRLNEYLIPNYQYFYFGSLIQRSDSSKAALYHILDNYSFEEVFFDVNLRRDCYTSETIDKSLRYCTILKVGDEEVSTIQELIPHVKAEGFEMFSKTVIRNYPNIRRIITTAGSEGSYIFEDSILHHVPTEPVKVVDAVGAGDSFSASFLATFTKTNNVVQSATIANKVGGFV
ncbi:MAG: PfkB family carbohydrate kinase, partial [Cyclobacteriaceae bacterium]